MLKKVLIFIKVMLHLEPERVGTVPNVYFCDVKKVSYEFTLKSFMTIRHCSHVEKKKHTRLY